MRPAILAALARRDFELIRSYRLALAFDLAWGVLDLLFYYFISKIIDPAAGDLGSAPSYFGFAVVGIVMSLVMYASSAEVAHRVREEQLTGTLEILCVQPVRTVELAFGMLVFPLLFAVLRAACYLAIAVLALGLDAGEADLRGVAVLLVAAGIAFAPIGIIAAAATVAFKRGASITTVIVFGMTFVSGALFPIALLPEWLQWIGRATPTWFAFEGVRSALFGGGQWEDDVFALLVFAIVAMPFAVWLLAAAIAHSKRQATLSQY